MPAKDLGTKHVCFKCGTRFYDLKKPEPICPKCGADQRQGPTKAAPEKRARTAARPAARPAAPAAPEPAETEVVEAEADEDLESDDDDDDDDDDE
jgi:hypothetical protein